MPMVHDKYQHQTNPIATIAADVNQTNPIATIAVGSSVAVVVYIKPRRDEPLQQQTPSPVLHPCPCPTTQHIKPGLDHPVKKLSCQVKTPSIRSLLMPELRSVLRQFQSAPEHRGPTPSMSSPLPNKPHERRLAAKDALVGRHLEIKEKYPPSGWEGRPS